MMKLEAKKKQQKRLEAEAKKRQELQEAALRVYRQREGSCTTIQKMVSGAQGGGGGGVAHYSRSWVRISQREATFR